MRPSSDSSISSLRRAKLTRAPLTTERSSAMRVVEADEAVIEDLDLVVG